MSKILHSEKLKKAGTVDFKNHPAQKVGTRSRAVSTQGSRQVRPSQVPKSWDLKHLAIQEDFSRNFRGIFLGSPRADPRIWRTLKST